MRDNQLNYMFGFAVYASVCAHLKEPLKFPGDYLAWDKEFCESSAMLNSYLSEYVSCEHFAGPRGVDWKVTDFWAQ